MTAKRAIYMIADDFTGAADAANYFCVNDWRVRVSFEPWSQETKASEELIVHVFDTESRALEPEEAAKRVRRAVGQMISSDLQLLPLYKKVDSTLRGHVGAEIDAILQSTQKRVALFAPSFPANGRVVRDGQLFVGGVPISATAFANDPHNPVTEDKVAKVIRQTASMPILEMNLQVIRNGIESIQAFLANIKGAAVCVVADAETDDDLTMLAHAVADNDEVLPCGSAGLAKQLASIWCGTPSGSETSVSEPSHCEHVVVAVGSANPVTAEQLAHLTCSVPSETVVVSATQLAQPPTHAAEMTRATRDVMASTEAVVVLTLGRERATRSDELEGTFERDLAQLVRIWLAERTSSAEAQIGIVATGGDTAFALCQELHAKAFWPQGELVSGMPWSWLETDIGRFPIVSKAGGFGSQEALYTAVSTLLRK